MIDWLWLVGPLVAGVLLIAQEVKLYRVRAQLKGTAIVAESLRQYLTRRGYEVKTYDDSGGMVVEITAPDGLVSLHKVY